MLSPFIALRRDAENRDTRIGDVSGLTATGGGVLGGVFGNSLFMLDCRDRRAGGLDGLLGLL